MHGRSKQGTLLRLYYPTNDVQENGKRLTPWFQSYEYTKGLSRFLLPAMPFVVESALKWSTRYAVIPSYIDAPVAQNMFPLIVFSHGLAANRIIYSVVCNDLASHGFIVAAIEHRDESASATFTLSDSGEKVYMMYEPPHKIMKQYSMRNQQVKIRANECIEALNVLENISEGKITKNELHSTLPIISFKGKIDTTHSILAGHSFGGSTTILALSKDKRFKLGVNMDPWMFPVKENLEALSLAVTQPMLFILAEGFLLNDINVKSYLPFNIDKNTFVTIKGTVHHSQTDLPFLSGFVGRAITDSWSVTDRYLALNLNNRLMINFICKHMDMDVDSYDSELADHSNYLIKGLAELVKKKKYGSNISYGAS